MKQRRGRFIKLWLVFVTTDYQRETYGVVGDALRGGLSDGT